MHHKTIVKNFICVLCSLVATVIAASAASAEEAPLDTLAMLDQQTAINSELDLTLSWPVETEDDRAGAFRLPEPRSQVVAFVKKCAELEAIPLVEIADEEDRHVYLGINFDGFLGIYARL